MKDKLFEAMFDDLVKKAGTKAILEMENECADEEVPEIEFSKEHEEKMKKFFEEYKAQQEAEEAQNKLALQQHKTKKTIALAAATVTVLALGITTVGAWKGNLLGSYLKNNGEYSDLLNGKAERSLTVENVYFGYVPDGYEFDGVKETESSKYITFRKNSELDIYFYIKIKNEVYKDKVNTESGELEELVVANKDMIYGVRDDFKFLTWFENNAQNTLYTNASKSELIKIAEKLEFLK